jgi:signal transduction histidine kinase
MLGESRSDLIEATLADETPVEEVIHSVDPLISGDQDEIRQTLWFETTDGPKPFHIRNTRGVTDDGEFVGLVSVLRDITDRIEIEEALQQQNERLDEFASLVSHDLRNPLNVAQGRLELARAEYEGEHLDAVAQAHDRMQTLIDDLLILARDGDSVSEFERVNLDATATRCWSNVETHSATVQVEADSVIQADPSRLNQLLENLFRNAVEHGGADVTITIGDLTDRSGFYITDDGSGISDEKREDVFEAG